MACTWELASPLFMWKMSSKCKSKSNNDNFPQRNGFAGEFYQPFKKEGF